MNDIYKYLSNDKDIEELLEKFLYFHDSVLKEIHYISGSYRNYEDNSLHPIDSIAEVRIIFESQCMNGMTLELIFELIERLNLVPIPIIYDSLFECPFITLKDEYTYFSRYEEDVNKLNESSTENTWIKSKYLKYIIR